MARMSAARKAKRDSFRNQLKQLYADQADQIRWNRKASPAIKEEIEQVKSALYLVDKASLCVEPEMKR